MNGRRPSSVPPPLDVQRIVDLLVFAPIGLGTVIVEDGPDAVRRARQELRNARFVGRIAVDQSVARLRDRLAADTEPVASTHDEPAGSTTSTDSGAAGDPPSAAVPDAPDADGLALPDYDTLPAIDIVDKLEHLTDDERAEIGRYESAHRQRRTVLGKLAQLADA